MFVKEMYCPPLTIRVVDCRSFGRFTLVGCQLIWTSQNKNIPRALKQILRLELTHLHRSTNSSTPQQCEVKQNSNLVHWGTSKGLPWGTNWTTSLMSNGDTSCPIWATNRRWTSGGTESTSLVLFLKSSQIVSRRDNLTIGVKRAYQVKGNRHLPWLCETHIIMETKKRR